MMEEVDSKLNAEIWEMVNGMLECQCSNPDEKKLDGLESLDSIALLSSRAFLYASYSYANIFVRIF